jgi:hypothetical protein
VEKLTAAYRRCFEVSSDDLSIALGEMLERVEVAIGQRAVPEAIAPPEKPVNKIDPHEVRDSQRLLATRDRYLASLRLGKQAPEYKRAKQHIDAFIKELEKAEV